MKRRKIKRWTRVHKASHEYICELCGGRITPTEEYRREVYVVIVFTPHPPRLEIERWHNNPDCRNVI